MRSTSRAVTFVLVASFVPAVVACNLLKHDTADAGPAASASAEQTTATATASGTAPAASSAAPVAPITPTPVSHKTVTVKLPDGGKANVDAGVLADGAVVLPPGFQFPNLAGFDAAALPAIPTSLPGFDASAFKIPTSLPPGFPTFPPPQQPPK